MNAEMLLDTMGKRARLIVSGDDSAVAAIRSALIDAWIEGNTEGANAAFEASKLAISEGFDKALAVQKVRP